MPCGIYAVVHDRGPVYVGTPAETAAFAMDAEQIAKAQAIGRDARYLAGWGAGHIAYAQPGDYH